MDDNDDHSRDASHYYRNDQFHADLDKLTPAQRRAFMDGDIPEPDETRRNPAGMILMSNDNDLPDTTNVYLRLASFKVEDVAESAPVLWLSEVEWNLN